MNSFNFPQLIEGVTGLEAPTQWGMLQTVVVVLVLWLGRNLLLRAVESRVEDPQSRYRWRKATTYFSFLIGAVLLTRIWFHGFQSISTMVGLISAGIAIALKDPLVNLAGWFFILWRQPFGVGDRIQVGDKVAGDVIDQRLFAFTLMEIGNWVDSDQSTGRIIHVPNGRVFTEVVANYSRGFKYIWDELRVIVTFESNWRDAKQVLDDIIVKHSEHMSERAEQRLREVSRKFMIFYHKLTPIVYTSVSDSGVMLTLRYLTEPQKRRTRQEAIWEDILDAFAKRDDIDFAYPTQRMYVNSREGKPGASKKEPANEPILAAPPGPGEDLFD